MSLDVAQRVHSNDSSITVRPRLSKVTRRSLILPLHLPTFVRLPFGARSANLNAELAMSSRIYSPLSHEREETRVLILEPSLLETDLIVGSLEVIRLGEPPPYEALSWFWGDATVTSTISLNSQRREVPRNLVEALTRFRRPTEQRTIWTDAVSINQDDLREREAQITMMGDIYRNASCTIVWLGSMGPSEDLDAYETLTRLGQGTSIRQIVVEHLGTCYNDDFLDDEEDFARLVDDRYYYEGVKTPVSSTRYAPF